MIKYGSVCSGIEAASVAWHPLGWRAAWFSEIEPFPCKLLRHHYPDIPNLGDMTKLYNNQIFLDAVIDLLVGGTPCQSFSLAGLREGLASENGNLALHFCRILRTKRPPPGSYGKTSPAYLVLTQMKQVVRKWKELDPSTGEILQKRQILQPSLQDFKNAGIVAPGVCLTANFSEFPSDAVGSSLSDILETTGDHLQRYCLSPTACAGILRRAKNREKALPEPLQQVLAEVAGQVSTRKS